MNNSSSDNVEFETDDSSVSGSQTEPDSAVGTRIYLAIICV